MLDELKKRVWKANLELGSSDLVVGTQGNVSGIDREKGLVIIKPSGVSYGELKAGDMAVVDMSGKIVEGLKPSVDTPHHLCVYRKMEDVGGVVHTHSPFATMFAILEEPVPCYSTGHADPFGGEIPCAPYADNIGDHIGEAICRYRRSGCPVILLGKHGVFSFDTTPAKAVKAAILAEFSARTAKGALDIGRVLGKKPEELSPEQIRLWYERYHGGGYGQE